MTPEDTLIELLDRVAALQGASVLINANELTRWPGEAVAVMKAQKLITKARPASSMICPECERECVMPVHVMAYPTGPAAFIICDKRSDINRVEITSDMLEQWQASGDSIANLLAGLLGINHLNVGCSSEDRWEIGIFKGKMHSSHFVLLADGRLTLTLAGHSIALAEVLSLEEGMFKVDKRKLVSLVDQPAAGAGNTESATQRRKRITKRVQEEKDKGTRAFLKVVAKEEGISVSRLKQLIKKKPLPSRPNLRW